MTDKPIERTEPEEFCRYCGASIPHRFGEGRCEKCLHHDPAYERTEPLKADPMIDAIKDRQDTRDGTSYGKDIAYLLAKLSEVDAARTAQAETIARLQTARDIAVEEFARAEAELLTLRAQLLATEENTKRGADLAQCYRLTGADPDGDDDSQLAPHAVAEVARLRAEHDELEAQLLIIRSDRDALRKAMNQP